MHIDGLDPLICPKCGRLLCEFYGTGQLEIKCRRCGSMVRFTMDAEGVHAKLTAPPSKPANQWYAASQRHKPGPTETK